jgi:hypothetical protein
MSDARRGGGAVLIGLLLSTAALAAAPALMPASYTWVANTTSESAAQGVSGAWLARLGFVLFGLSVILLAAACVNRWGRWAVAFHASFGVFMITAAAFATRSWTGAPFDRTEDALHSAAATAMGFGYAIGVITTFARARRRGQPRPWWPDAVAVASSVAVPMGMIALPDVDGVLQRVMFAIAYAWYASEAVRSLVPARAAARRAAPRRPAPELVRG